MRCCPGCTSCAAPAPCNCWPHWWPCRRDSRPGRCVRHGTAGSGTVCLVALLVCFALAPVALVWRSGVELSTVAHMRMQPVAHAQYTPTRVGLLGDRACPLPGACVHPAPRPVPFLFFQAAGVGCRLLLVDSVGAHYWRDRSARNVTLPGGAGAAAGGGAGGAATPYHAQHHQHMPPPQQQQQQQHTPMQQQRQQQGRPGGAGGWQQPLPQSLFEVHAGGRCHG